MSQKIDDTLPADFWERSEYAYACTETGRVFYCYETCIMDFGWESMRSLHEAMKATVDGWAAIGHHSFSDGLAFAQEIYNSYVAAENCLRQAGYDGYPRDDSHVKVFALPDALGDPDGRYGFVIKQDNNGTTYVASPYAIPSYEDGNL